MNFSKHFSSIIFFIALAFSVFLLLAPMPLGMAPKVLPAAAVVLLAVALWSTAVVPSALGSVIFLFAAVVLSVAPASIVFSGFYAGATWLVFGGLVVGLGVRRSGLDVRLINTLLKRLPSSYLGIVYGIFFVAFMLAWVVPSASARVALLVPIVLSLNKRLGFEVGSKGHNGLVLASAMGTMTPAFGILPSNVPNMALFGAIESIHGIRIAYAEYLFLNFPVIGIGAVLIYPLVIFVLFKDQPKPAVGSEVTKSWSIDEKKLLIIVMGALFLWLTDTLHGVSPAWVALGAALICLLPKLGLLPPKTLSKEMDYGPMLFVAGVIGLGAVATHSGLGKVIATSLLEFVPLEPGADGSNFPLIVLIGTVVGIFTTMPAQPSIMVPMASAMASASGWPLMSILMAPVVTWMMFPFFYQAPPVVLAVALGELKIWWVIRMLLVYMIMSIIILLPIHFLWGQSLGYFVSG